MTYVVPQVRVFQNVTPQPEVDVLAMRAFICGGHAVLYRFAEASEKAAILLGRYDHVGSSIDGEFKTCYAWPSKPASAVVDGASTKVFVQDALLRYWLQAGGTMTRTARNKIKHPTKAFKDNPVDPTTYPRAADFLDRDVQLGDIVKVTGSSDGGTTTFTRATYVKAIEAEQTSAVTGAATAVSGNTAAGTAADTDAADADNSGDVVISAVTATAWDGRPVGVVSETYTVTVVQASSGGDHTTALLQVTSASGLDDDTVTPAAAGQPTAIGDLGLTATFANGTGTDFVVGDTWTITVEMDYATATATSGGTYTGTANRLYIVEVTKGGDWGDSPELTVTTAEGTDFSGPHVLTVPTTTTAAPTTSVAPELTASVAIGNYGVTVSFAGHDGLMLGDRWTIQATAATNGHYRILVLGHDLDALIPLNDAANSDLEVSLCIKSTVELPEDGVTPGQYNWEQNSQQICLFSGIEAYHSSWTDDGVQVALPVIGDASVANTSQLYVEYRAWDQTWASSIGSISDVADLDDTLDGPLTPANELKWALYKALSNNNGQEVLFMAVGNPALTASWQLVLDKIELRRDAYNLVPLTRNTTVLGLFEAHVQSSSNETDQRWRVLWTSLDEVTTEVVVNATIAGETVLATTEDDAEEAGTQYTILQGTPGSGFFENVRAGDTVRYRYATDAWGNESYAEYAVEAKINDDTLRLVTGTPSAETTPIKTEVWRTLTAAEQAANLGTASGVWADRRIRSVWPNALSSGGIESEGYVLCAALAAQSSGVVPHQSLTAMALNGFDDVPQTTRKFTKSQLDHLAEHGTWIVTQDPETGIVYTRHALTTGDYTDVVSREEMITRNLDSISFYWSEKFAPYIGKANAVPGMLEVIRAETKSGIQYLRTRNETQMLGGQLVDGEITELRRSLEFSDRINLTLLYTLPAPLNNIDVYQNVQV